MEDILQPLVNQPGERFEYGVCVAAAINPVYKPRILTSLYLQISVDWAGILVERATGVNLNDYMQRHIFEPSNAKDMTMIPSNDMKGRLQGLWQRDEHGRVNNREYPLSRPLKEAQLHDDDDMIFSGGGGLFGSVRDFGSK